MCDKGNPGVPGTHFPSKKLIDVINANIAQYKEYGMINTKDISDTYHTIGELYDHRMALTVALCHTIDVLVSEEKASAESRGCISYVKDLYCYKSWLHSDGTMFDGMFIVVIESDQGQISYHYNAEHWDKFNIEERPQANEYDGHTPADCVERLINL